MYKIHVFDETFSLLATVAMIAENVTFSSFYSNCHKGNKFVHHNFAANQSKLPPEKWSHIVKGYLKNCIKGVSSTPLLKTQTLTRGSKCTKNYFLRFYYHLSHAWVGLICWTCFVFLKYPWWPVWRFCAQDLLKGTILSGTICMLLNIELFWKKYSLWLLMQWMFVIKNFGELTWAL